MSASKTVVDPSALLQELARLQAEVDALKAAKGKISLKISEKKAISMFGFRRMGVTLYAPEWEIILDPKNQEMLRKFIADHKAELSWARE